MVSISLGEVIVYLLLLDACFISALVLCVVLLHSFSFILFGIYLLLGGSILWRGLFGLVEKKELGLDQTVLVVD